MSIIEIDHMGSIIVNGSSVTEIIVDGKSISNPRAKYWSTRIGGSRLIPSVALSLTIDGLNAEQLSIETKTTHRSEPRSEATKRPNRVSTILNNKRGNI